MSPSFIHKRESFYSAICQPFSFNKLENSMEKFTCIVQTLFMESHFSLICHHKLHPLPTQPYRSIAKCTITFTMKISTSIYIPYIFYGCQRVRHYSYQSLTRFSLRSIIFYVFVCLVWFFMFTFRC